MSEGSRFDDSRDHAFALSEAFLTFSETEFSEVPHHRRRVQDLEQDRDALLESMAEMVPEALDSLTGEEKSRAYRMLRLEVTPTTEGYDVSGALCTSVTPSG